MKNCLFLDQPAGRGPVEHWLSAARRSHMLAWVGPLGHPPGLAKLVGWPTLVDTAAPDPPHACPATDCSAFWPAFLHRTTRFPSEMPTMVFKCLHLIGSVSSSLLHLGSLLRKPNFILTETGQASDSQFVSQRWREIEVGKLLFYLNSPNKSLSHRVCFPCCFLAPLANHICQFGTYLIFLWQRFLDWHVGLVPVGFWWYPGSGGWIYSGVFGEFLGISWFRWVDL